MWSLCVVIDRQVLVDFPACSEIAEDMLIQVFLSGPAIDRLYTGVLHQPSRYDVMPTDALVLAPSKHNVTCHFCPIVRDGYVWLAAPADQLIQLAGHTGAGQRTMHNGCPNFSRAVIHYAQHSEMLGSAKASDTMSSDHG